MIERSAAIDSKPVARQIMQESIVLARTADGDILALADRCPHLGVPLSHGRLLPRGLMCRYHGWSFDRYGRCTSVPGMSPDAIGEIRVQSYRIQELQGLVWITRSVNALLAACVVEMHAGTPLCFLWDKKWLEPAHQLQARLSTRYFSDGSVTQVEVRAIMGCTVWITLSITPCTASTCRVFAMSHLKTRWLPQWVARRVALATAKRFANPQSLLAG